MHQGDPLSAAAFLVGLAFLAVIVGGSLASAAIVTRRRLPWLTGTERVLAFALIFTAALIASNLLPAMLGVLSRWSAAITALLLLTGAWRLRAVDGAPEPLPEPVAESGPASIAIATVAAGAVALLGLAYVLHVAVGAPTGTDTLNFHLPGVARWIQSGSIWHINQWVPNQAHGNYPNDGDVVLLAGVLPWRDDFMVRFIFLPWLALTGLAVYVLARELRAPRAASVVFGSVIVALPNVLFDVVDGTLPDVVMLSAFTGGVAFLLRHWRTRRTSDLLLAGLGLGLAFGTKWFGLSSAIAVIAVWCSVSLVAKIAPRRVVRDLLMLGGVVLAAGGVWLLRNWILSGNPFFPQRISLLGLTIFDAPRDQIRELAGFSISHYAGNGHLWIHVFLPAFRHALGAVAAPLLLVGAGLATGLAFRRPRPERRLVLTAAATVAVLFVVYTLTPYTAFGFEGKPFLTFINVRYMLPAAVVAAALGAWSAGAMGRAGLLLELAGLAAVIDGMRRTVILDAKSLGIALIVLVVAVFAALAARGVRARTPGAQRSTLASRRKILALGAVALLGLGTAAGLYRYQDGMAATRYRGDPTIDYVLDNYPAGHRIGLTGVWSSGAISPVEPLFGPRLTNDVVYVGPFGSGMLKRYRNQGPFISHLDRGHYDALEVALGQPPKAHVREQSWAVRAGYRLVARSPRFALYLRE